MKKLLTEMDFTNLKSAEEYLFYLGSLAISVNLISDLQKVASNAKIFDIDQEELAKTICYQAAQLMVKINDQLAAFVKDLDAEQSAEFLSKVVNVSEKLMIQKKKSKKAG